MIPKQDRQGVRQAKDIEQKYDLNKDFSSIEKIAANAQRAAEQASSKAESAESKSDKTAQNLETLSNEFYILSETVGKNTEAISDNAETITKLDNRVDKLEESGTGGGTVFTTDETLSLKDGVLSVNRATRVEADNTLPITSAAVYMEIGNIDALLQTI